MEMKEEAFDGDKALRLFIYMDDATDFSIFEMVNHISEEDGSTRISEYPLVRLRQLFNAWLRYDKNRIMRIERTIRKEGNTEIISERILYIDEDKVKANDQN
jgi:hypothetical protein